MTTTSSGTAKATVRTSYDQMAEQYSRRRTMQSGNLGHLAALVEEATDGIDVRRMLDVGCGDGQGFGTTPAALHHDALVVGVDLSFELLRMGHELLQLPHFAAGDAEDLPLRSSTFDLVVSNSVLHWLNAPQFGLDAAGAVREIARVLRPGGVVCVSVAGDGTAKVFQRAYATVSARYRERGLLDASLHRPDPVGSMPLHQLVDQFLTAGLHVRRAWLSYEPVEYPRAADYAADVAAYGFGPYTAAAPPAQRDRFFDEITEQFVADHGDGPYVHDQYMVYLWAQRPS